MPLQLDALETTTAAPGQHHPPLSIAHGGAASLATSSNSNEDYLNHAHARASAPTSSATLNSILTTTTTPTIPQKRKSSAAGLGIYHYDAPVVHHSSHNATHVNHHTNNTNIASPALSSTSILPPPPPLSSAPPQAGSTASAPQTTPQNDVSNDAIDCMCGFIIDDGYSIQCDNCSRWCHAVCFGIMKEDTVPDVWACWVCQPRPREMREAAVKMQKERFAVYGGGVGLGLGGGVDGGLLLMGEDGVNGREGKRGRKLSPGNDRKGGRRASAAGAGAIDGGGKRRRRPSVIQPSANASSPNINTTTTLNHNTAVNGGAGAATTDSGAAEDQHVDIDEPWKDSYVHISEDIIPSDETRYKLRKQAQNWRGITAVSTPSPPSAPPPPIAVKELPPQTAYNPLLTLNSNPSVLPPTYGLHTTAPISSDRLITPYTSSITPSSSYLSDPLNAYAHLGMPKPFVHLLGPPIDVALDSRLVGNYGRFVRSGCRPNAVLRPVLCNKRKDGEEDKENRDHNQEEDGRTLGFGVFALRDLKAGEEIVLGWEWDDGNAVHCLPALLSTPHMFPADRFHLSSSNLNSTPTFSSPDLPTSTSTSFFHSTPAPTSDFLNSSSSNKRSQEEIARLRGQIAHILAALSSTFTTCACGGRARDCVLTQMATFVDQPPEADQERSPGEIGKEVDLGPLVGRKRGFKTRERIPNSGGIGGMEMWVDEEKGEGGSRRVVNGHGGLHNGVKQVNGTGNENGGGLMGPPPVPANRRSRSPPPAPPLREVEVGRVTRSRKGKERAVILEENEDVEMDDESRFRLGTTPTSNSSKPHSPPVTPPSPPGAPPSPNSRPQTSRPPPPDPPPVPPDPNTQEKDETKMPPKMRKKWMHHELEKLMKDREKEAEAAIGEEERVGLGIRIEVEDTAVAVAQRDSSMPPPPAPAFATLAASTPPKSPPSSLLPSQTISKPSISSTLSLLTPTMTPTVPASDMASTPHLSPSSTSMPAVAALNAAPSPSPLGSFANLSLLSPALLNGPQTPSIPSVSQLQQIAGEKKTGFLFPPDRTESPSPSPADEGWTPLRRVESAEKSVVVQEKIEEVQIDAGAELNTEDRESSIASSSGGVPPPKALRGKQEKRGESEDVEMKDAAENRKQDDIPAGSAEVDPKSDHDRQPSPSAEVPPPPLQEPQPEDNEAMEVDEAPEVVRCSPTPPPPSESSPNAATSEEPPPEISPAITISAPEPRAISPPHSVSDSVQPSPATLLSSLPSPSPSPAPGAHASSSSHGQGQAFRPAQQPKVKLTLQDFVLRKKKQKEKEKEARLEKGRDKESSEEKDKVEEKAVGSTGEGDKAEKEEEKNGETAAALPATTTSTLSPTSTTTPTTPAFDPKAFSEAAAAILNGQHRPSPQHLPTMSLEFVNGFPRIRGASPLVASLTASSSSQPQPPPQAQKEPTAPSHPTLKVNETKEMKREVVEASLSLSTLASVATDGPPKEQGKEDEKDKPAPIISQSTSPNPQDPPPPKPPNQHSQHTGGSGSWGSPPSDMPWNSQPWMVGMVQSVASVFVNKDSLPAPPRPAKPAQETEPQREHEHHQEGARSVSPMGPDLLRPEIQVSPPLFAGGFNAHSRMPSREDGEIVGEATSPPLASANITPSSLPLAGRGLQYQQRQPSLPMSPSVPTTTKPNFGSAESKIAPRLPWGPSISPSPSFTRDPPTGPSYYQRIGASRAGRPGGQDGSMNSNSTGATANANTTTNPNTTQPEPPKAPRALRQSMLSNRGAGGGAGAGISGGAGSPGGSAAGGSGSPVNSNPIPIPSPYTRTPSQSHIYGGTSSTPTPSMANGILGSSFIPRGPSADRERDQQDRERYRLGERDRDGGRDGAGGGASLRDRLDWDRYPRGSGSGLRRWGR